MQLGKYSNDRDNILHFLCLVDWATESFGNVEAPTGYVWRISNTPNDVSLANTEFNTVIEEQVKLYSIVDNEEFRSSLVGHFLITEDSNGLVFVGKYDTEYGLLEDYATLEQEFSEWDEQGEAY